MNDHEQGLRRAAAHAVELARRTPDPNVRTALLDLAQKWVDQVPAAEEAERELAGALEEFNTQQIVAPPRAAQQKRASH